MISYNTYLVRRGIFVQGLNRIYIKKVNIDPNKKIWFILRNVKCYNNRKMSMTKAPDGIWHSWALTEKGQSPFGLMLV